MTTREQGTKKPKAVPTNFDQLPDSAFVPVTVPAALLDISLPTVWRWIRAGKLPPAVKFGEGTTRLNVGKLRQAIARIAA